MKGFCHIQTEMQSLVLASCRTCNDRIYCPYTNDKRISPLAQKTFEDSALCGGKSDGIFFFFYKNLTFYR